jgi:hypothetical protein
MSVRRGVQIQQGVEIDHVIMSLALAGNSRSGRYLETNALLRR